MRPQTAFRAATFVVSIMLFAPHAGAEDAWRPAGQNDEVDSGQPARRERATRPEPAAGRPYLRSMDAPDFSQTAGSARPAPAAADDAYRPEAAPAPEPQPRPPARAPATSTKRTAPDAATAMRDAVPAPVDKGDLAPVMAADGSGVPFELWRGVDMAAFGKLISEIEIPPRSAALHSLWKRLITSDVTPPAGESSNVRFASLRLEALYRSGLAGEASAEFAKAPRGSDPLLDMLAARNELANANREKACEIAGKGLALKGDVPKQVKAEAVLLNGYCAAAAGDTAGAGLAAELAREEGQSATPGLAALDALSIGAKPKIALNDRISLVDYRLLEIASSAPGAAVLEKAEPALLVALTNDSATEPALRLAAAESAARLNAISPDALAAIYAATGGAATADALLSAAQPGGPERRAALFKAAEAERTPMKKTRLMRALVDDGRRNGLAFQTMQMLARAASQIKPEQELSWFTETAAEIGLAAGNYGMTRAWVALSGPNSANGQGFGHWLALADIADAAEQPRGAHLGELEALALRSRFTPDALHRLATVLDALDYVVPIPLWEAASRTPQPASGHLPATGVLSALQDAAKKKEFGRTVLLAMQALGPNGAEGAHMISLGDSIRALKRAGLEPDARRLALEALLGAWPRTAVN